jgi:hypothetical protein
LPLLQKNIIYDTSAATYAADFLTVPKNSFTITTMQIWETMIRSFQI